MTRGIRPYTALVTGLGKIGGNAGEEVGVLQFGGLMLCFFAKKLAFNRFNLQI